MPVHFVQRRDFLSGAECDLVRAALDRGKREAAEVLGEQFVLDTAHRQASYVTVDRRTRSTIERRLEDVRAALEADLHRRLGPREGVGFLRYTSGGFFAPHRDCGDVPAWPGAARRAVSIVVFLNSAGRDFDGGTLRLMTDDPIEVVPAAGTLVAFPSACLHEVRPVTRGIRDVIVDWFYGPTPARDRTDTR
jgi:predicted 2-oxoglutarate/Fe(II)-dependent dioxygenase YbiX